MVYMDFTGCGFGPVTVAALPRMSQCPRCLGTKTDIVYKRDPIFDDICPVEVLCTTCNGSGLVIAKPHVCPGCGTPQDEPGMCDWCAEASRVLYLEYTQTVRDQLAAA